jgi:hypothetical protein
VVLGPHQAVGVNLDVVEEQLPLHVGVAGRGREPLALQAGRVDVHDEQRQQAAPGLLVGAGAGDHQQGVRVLHARDEGLGAP